jgi:hypothetical protein
MPACGELRAALVIWVTILAVLWVGAAVFAMALAVMARRGDEQLKREREAAEPTSSPDERFSRDGAPMKPRARTRFH